MFDPELKFSSGISFVCYQLAARCHWTDCSAPEGLFVCRLNLLRPWLNVDFFRYRLSTAKTGLPFMSMETLLDRLWFSHRRHLMVTGWVIASAVKCWCVGRLVIGASLDRGYIFRRWNLHWFEDGSLLEPPSLL